MFSTLRNRFGIPGVISVIALVFAMFGGAYAASNSSGGGKATASAKAKKGPRGPKGPKGDTGPAGPQGPAGPAGAKGDTGAPGSNGTNGTNGAPGAPGTSVTNTALAKGNVNCPEGGAEFKVGAGTPTRACNGVTGFTETLPSGKTETGKWTAVGLYALGGGAVPFAAISYSIPLAAPSEHVVYLNATQTTNSVTTPVEGCKFEVGNPAAVPVAPAGTLCVFTRSEEAGEVKDIGAAVGNDDSRSGTSLYVELLAFTPEFGAANLDGTWAVTAK
jgi:hypothetical protein